MLKNFRNPYSKQSQLVTALPKMIIDRRLIRPFGRTFRFVAPGTGNEIGQFAMSRDSINNDLFRINNHLCSFSQDGRLFAFAFQGNLVIKNTGTYDTFQSFPFVDIIEYIEWSPDDKYILCASIRKAIIQVFSICYTEWRCKLIEGSAGLERVSWAPGSRDIITTADLNIQISLWSLEKRNVTYIQNLKSSANENLEFSPNGKRLALIVTDQDRDSVDIYRTGSWKISRKLICERLSSIDGICWSPNNELLCIWSSTIGDSKLLAFSTRSESHIGVYCPEDRSKDSEFKKELRGINKIKWMPGGQLLAVAGHSELVVLLNYITWKPISELYHGPVIRETNYSTRVYKECVMSVGDPNKQPPLTNRHILEEIIIRPLNLPIIKKVPNSTVVAEVDIMEFSSCGRYLATRHQMYPTTLWIWDISADSVDYLLLGNSVSNVKWDPTRVRLMVFTESAHIFEWRADGAACLQTPKGIIVSDGQWHPRGNTLALCGYNKVAIYHIGD